VCTDTNWGWGGPFNQQGSWHLWGFKDGGDAQTGELRSGTFKLGGNGQVSVMIGGGNDVANLYVGLVRASDNLMISKQTGNNSEAYTTKTLNGSAYIGTQCYISIFDGSTGGFGHINADNIVIPISNGSGGRLATGSSFELQSENHSNGFNIFPNPASDYTTVDLREFTGGHVVTVLDAAGKTVIHRVVDGGTVHTISLQAAQNGMYIVQVKGQQRTVFTKLIVNK
jgi:hypothetical protein